MNDTIILYSTGCPKCQVLKRKLDEKNIVYTVCDSVDEMLGLGISQVPVLKINDTLLDFSGAVSWLNNSR